MTALRSLLVVTCVLTLDQLAIINPRARCDPTDETTTEPASPGVMTSQGQTSTDKLENSTDQVQMATSVPGVFCNDSTTAFQNSPVTIQNSSAADCSSTGSDGAMDNESTTGPSFDISVHYDNGTDDKATISPALYQRWRRLVWGVIIPTISLIGVASDSLGIFVLLKGKLSQTFRCFLCSLMATDVFYLLCNLTWCIPTMLEQHDKYLANFLSTHMHSTLDGMTTTAYAICAHLITLMSLERLCKVVFPIRMKRVGELKHAKLVVLAVYICNIALMMPAFFIARTMAYVDPASNRTMYKLVPTEWAANTIPFRTYFPTILIVLTKFVPVAITLVCNTSICVALSRRGRMRSSSVSAGTQTEQLRMTITLIVLALFLTLSLIPSSIAFIIARFHPGVYQRGGREFLLYSIVIEAGELLSAISASNDFVIYICTSKQTRDVLLKMCCSRRASGQGHPQEEMPVASGTKSLTSSSQLSLEQRVETPIAPSFTNRQRQSNTDALEIYD